MGIVQSQVFEFETDDLNVMRAVLETMVPIWFWHGKADFSCCSKLNPNTFNDGSEREDGYYVVETGQGAVVAQPKRIYGGVRVLSNDKPDRWQTLDEASRDAASRNKQKLRKPEYMWLTSLEGPYSRPYGEEVEFHSVEAAVKHLLDAFEQGDKEKFRRECAGEPRWFDGSSTAGYRINQRWGTVYASYCTILYGK